MNTQGFEGMVLTQLSELRQDLRHVTVLLFELGLAQGHDLRDRLEEQREEREEMEREG